MLEEIRRWSVDNHKQIHKNGYIVLGPPGIGKTTFVSVHPRQWVDADEIFRDLGLHRQDWHSREHSEAETEKHYLACDAALGQMRECGLWVIGSLFWDFRADAIVLIEENTHESYVKQRPDLQWSSVSHIRTILQEMAGEKDIPVYKSIQEAANHTTFASIKQHVYST